MSSATYIARDSNNAFEAIEREITASKSLRRFLIDYGVPLGILACYAPFCWSSWQSSGVVELVVVVLSFYAVAEVRAQQRQKLLLEALRELQRLVIREATSNA